MNIIFGKNGQVAKCLFDLLQASNKIHEWRFFGSDECDFSRPENVETFLHSLPFIPKVIINAAAYTAVDLAETEKEKALNINAVSVGKIANYCAKNNTTFVHYSTDYIFDGKGTTPFKINDAPSPLNHYGHSKLEGEKLITASKCNHYIIRVSWVYSQYGKNFVKTMLSLMATKPTLSIVGDQTGSPTSAIEIATTTLSMLENKYPFGTYHFTGEGYCSWHDFAVEISKQGREQGFQIITETINSIPTSQYPTPAQRPLNSRMELGTLKSKATPWQTSLARVISLLK